MERPMPRPIKRAPLRITHGFRSGTFPLADTPMHGYVLEDASRVVPFADAHQLLGLPADQPGFAVPLARIARSLATIKLFDTKRTTWFSAPMLAVAAGSSRDYEVLAVEHLSAIVEAINAAVERKIAFPMFELVAKRAKVVAAAIEEVRLVDRIDSHAGYTTQTMPALEWVGAATAPRGDAIPDEFFSAIARLRGEPDYAANARPSYYGWIIRNLVYQRLGPGVYEAMKDAAERLDGGRHRTRLYQHLNDAGRDALDAQVQTVLELAKKARDYDHLLELVEKASPRYK